MVHVLQTTQNLVILSRRFEEDDTEMYFFCSATFPLPLSSWFRKLSNFRDDDARMRIRDPLSTLRGAFEREKDRSHVLSQSYFFQYRDTFLEMKI